MSREADDHDDKGGDGGSGGGNEGIAIAEESKKELEKELSNANDDAVPPVDEPSPSNAASPPAEEGVVASSSPTGTGEGILNVRKETEDEEEDDDDDEDLFGDADEDDKDQKEGAEGPASSAAAATTTASSSTTTSSTRSRSTIAHQEDQPLAVVDPKASEEKEGKGSLDATADNNVYSNKRPAEEGSGSSNGAAEMPNEQLLSSSSTSSTKEISSIPRKKAKTGDASTPPKQSSSSAVPPGGGLGPDAFGFPLSVRIPPVITKKVLNGKTLELLKRLPPSLVSDALGEYEEAIDVKGESIRNKGAYLYGVVKRYCSVHERAMAGEGSGILPMGDSLTPPVQLKLEGLVKSGFCTREDMNEKVKSKIRMLNERDALIALDELASSDPKSIRNLGSYVVGILHRFMRGEPGPNNPHPQPRGDRGTGGPPPPHHHRPPLHPDDQRRSFRDMHHDPMMFPGGGGGVGGPPPPNRRGSDPFPQSGPSPHAHSRHHPPMEPPPPNFRGGGMNRPPPYPPRPGDHRPPSPSFPPYQDPPSFRPGGSHGGPHGGGGPEMSHYGPPSSSSSSHYGPPQQQPPPPIHQQQQPQSYPSMMRENEPYLRDHPGSYGSQQQPQQQPMYSGGGGSQQPQYPGSGMQPSQQMQQPGYPAPGTVQSQHYPQQPSFQTQQQQQQVPQSAYGAQQQHPAFSGAGAPHGMPSATLPYPLSTQQDGASSPYNPNPWASSSQQQQQNLMGAAGLPGQQQAPPVDLFGLADRAASAVQALANSSSMIATGNPIQGAMGAPYSQQQSQQNPPPGYPPTTGSIGTMSQAPQPPGGGGGGGTAPFSFSNQVPPQQANAYGSQNQPFPSQQQQAHYPSMSASSSSLSSHPLQQPPFPSTSQSQYQHQPPPVAPSNQHPHHRNDPGDLTRLSPSVQRAVQVCITSCREHNSTRCALREAMRVDRSKSLDSFYAFLSNASSALLISLQPYWGNICKSGPARPRGAGRSSRRRHDRYDP
jgi:hypothetical protein